MHAQPWTGRGDACVARLVVAVVVPRRQIPDPCPYATGLPLGTPSGPVSQCCAVETFGMPHRYRSNH